MADVHTEREVEKGGTATWAWVLVVVLLIGLIAWFLFGRGGNEAGDAGDINVDVSSPATAPATTPEPATP